MKANELRIGNFVWLKSHHYPVQVEQIFKYHDDSIWIGTDLHEGERLEDYEPIELTEEWLLKFGFEQIKWYLKKITEADAVEFNLSYDCDYKLWFIANIHFVDAGIKFVHQLQNLYFALTSEELVIKD